ncbi:carbamoyltransferase HypF [Butyrivibrio sp. WCD2001]|uniref:carbamoyltransferase HypF n=1 Tax=Butyrivibrio sp. WCD2001 TaxID=1280681 RepID=UPI000419C4EF|nr:carbamoyltransferase HypF [Butyrivibrio sp. WCD2001]
MKALIRVTGAVQGVGYRPFVAELANKYELRGEVKNLGGIVEITAEGDGDKISSFADELRTNSPSGSIVLRVSLDYSKCNEPEGQSDHSGFRIVESSGEFDKNYLPVFPPDIGICPECMKELLDKKDRRHRYPLISCASCGPRFSILKELPYDRETTTMGVFSMCPVCEKEYRSGRRRHAQTISCHDCGPQIVFRSGSDGDFFEKEDALSQAIRVIRDGGIIGIKGIGGYQLAASPYNYDTVKRLRLLKGREQKPFAVMFDSVRKIEQFCFVSELEKKYLESSARPIVLLDKKEDPFAENVCGDSRQIGGFLPSSGVHRLLTLELSELIVTSGNISGEPMITDDTVFADKFGDSIDGILYYERDILRPLDDSVLQIYRTEDDYECPRFIRRARGYVPLPMFLEKPLKEKILYEAYGADLKNSFAIGFGDRIIQSQFLGDMEDYSVLKLQRYELAEFEKLFRTDNLSTEKKIVISDMHPGYHSSALADEAGGEHLKIQHHHAHIGSVMAENALTECIGVAFDGTGYGTDNTIWGSEFLICRSGDFERAGHFKSVRIAGSDEAMKNAEISAFCYLYDSGIDIPDHILNESEKGLLKAALQNNINVHKSSGMGRLFDAVSCILGVCNYNSYEGECAIKLQNKAEDYLKSRKSDEIVKDLPISDLIRINYDNEEYIPDMQKLLGYLTDNANRKDIGMLAYAFHNVIAQITLRVCLKLRERTGLNSICLSGGVFTNRVLLSLCERLLVNDGFVVYYNRVFPTNDQGISAGQIYLADLKEKSN